ncbi:hypothetical protein [Streptomyces sp. NPDC004788]
MGLSVWPAPEDSGVVGPTGATGPQGPKGDIGAIGPKGDTGSTGSTGAPGSQLLTGTAAPNSGTGVDGDMYVQDDTRTYLGVTSTTLTFWKKTAGTWTKVGNNVGGSKWYVNNASTSSTDTKPGDMLLRIDTGDIWQRGASGWGTSIGNLKGAKGDTGATGPQGPKGDPGSVDTVNGKAGPAVTLTATDVNALPLAGGTLTGHTEIRPTTGHALTAYGSSDASTFFRVTDAGHPYSNSLRSTFYNVGVGDTTTPFGGGVRVLGLQNASTVPTTNPANGVVAYAEGGVMKVRQSDGTIVTVGGGGVSSVNGKTGAVTLTAADVSALASTTRGAANGVASLDLTSKIPIAQIPNAARNAWTPQALGFQAWSVDPAAVANPTTLKAAVIQRLYFAGINITEPTPVSKVVVHARGWGGSTLIPAARFMAGIYSEAGSRVAWTGSTALSNVQAAGQETGTPTDAKDNHIGAVPLNLTATTTLQPGRYWAAFLMTAGAATDFYYMHIQNEAPSNPSNFHLLGTAFMRAGYLASQTTLPASITPSSMKLDLDPMILALA